MTQIPNSPGGAEPRSTRLMSLDALRGFDMFWIVGADAIVGALRKHSQNPFLLGLAEQLEHVEWAGFHFEDLIFPLFVFIVGVSLVYSSDSTIARSGRGAAVTRIARRTLLLYLLGLFCYGGFSRSFTDIRLLGVLQRIALVYGASALLYVFLGWRGRLAVTAGLLVGYWAAMAYIPVPEIGAGQFEPGLNLANWIDSQYLPLRKWDGAYDPEGLLSTLPAIASCLIGVFAGEILKDPASPGRKVLILLTAGVALASAGWLWHDSFPVIKKIWTSSFVLVAAGYSSILLGLFYLVIDLARIRFWAMPFVWIGMNPITIYMLDNLVDLGSIARRLAGGELASRFFHPYEGLVLALVQMLLVFLIARFLYKRKLFIRL